MAQLTVRERACQQSRKLTDYIFIHTKKTENQKFSQVMLETLKTQDPVNTSSRQAPLLKVSYITHKHHHQLQTKGSNTFKPLYGQGEDYLTPYCIQETHFGLGAWLGEQKITCCASKDPGFKSPEFTCIVVHIFSLTSSRGEAKTGKSPEVYKPANLMFATVNEGLFLNTSER